MQLEEQLEHDEGGGAAAPLNSLVASHLGEILAAGDANLYQRLGWSALRQRRADTAATWFGRSLGVEPNQPSVRYGQALALREAGSLELAYKALAPDQDAQADALKGDLAIALAESARTAEDFEAERQWLTAAGAAGRDDDGLRTQLAWSAYHLGQDDESSRRFADLYARHPDNDNAAGLFYSLQLLKQSSEIDRLEAQGGPIAPLARHARSQSLLNLGLPVAAASIDPDVAPAVRGILEPSLRLGGALRDKEGTPGSSQLQVTRLPDLSVRWPTGAQAWMFNLAHVRLDAGTGQSLSGGGLQASAISTNVDAGWEPSLQWTLEGPDSWSAGLGLTPLSGPVAATPTGSLGWRQTASDHALGIRSYAEPVRDSILSYVGSQSSTGGAAWGRVVRYGLASDGFVNLGGWSVGGGASLEDLKGRNVQDNSHVGLSATLSKDLGLSTMRYFSVGPSLGYEHYAQNLSGFTATQGGYFSPQNFVTAGLGVSFLTEEGRRFVARGRMFAGWQSVQQDAAPCSATALPGTCAGPAASTSRGLGSSSELEASYLLTPRWELTGNLGLRTGPAYRDRVVFLGLRYNFGARSALFAEDLPQAARALW